MNPTPEQVAQWAREAGIPIGPLDDDYCKAVGLPLGTMCNVDGIGMEEVTRLVTRAMAEQAEADAKELVATSEYKAGYRDGYNRCNDEIKGLFA